MGILCWSLLGEARRCCRLLLLPFWPLLPLLSLRPSPRLKLTPTFSMVDMVDMDWDTLAMLATMLATMEDMVLDIMASVRLSLRLMLTPTFCTEDTMDMVLDGYSGLGYHGLGYRVYGKRSADAEPKADPYLLYGGYAGHLGYAGHYGYPYGGYAYYG